MWKNGMLYLDGPYILAMLYDAVWLWLNVFPGGVLNFAENPRCSGRQQKIIVHGHCLASLPRGFVASKQKK